MNHLAPRHFHPLINNFIVELQAGVPVFFTLSGFLICHRYYDQASTGKSWYKNYLVNRFARIYPVFFVVTVVNCLFKSASFSVLILNVFLLHGFLGEYVFSPLPQTWSLTVEVTFYLLAPLIFFMFRKKVNVIIQFILFLIIGAIITFAFSKINYHGFFEDINFMLVLTFFGRCFEFLAGVYLCLFIRRNVTMPFSKQSFTWLAVLLLPCLVFVISICGGLTTFKGIFLHNVLLPVVVCMLIYGLVVEQSVFRTFLSGSIMQLLGKSSYCFFLIHAGFLHSLFYTHVVANLFAELIFTSLVSLAAYKLLEQPAHNRIRKWFAKNR